MTNPCIFILDYLYMTDGAFSMKALYYMWFVALNDMIHGEGGPRCG